LLKEGGFLSSCNTVRLRRKEFVAWSYLRVSESCSLDSGTFGPVCTMKASGVQELYHYLTENIRTVRYFIPQPRCTKSDLRCYGI
jgi:hypothetical protein